MALLGGGRLHVILIDSRGKGLGDLIRTRSTSGEPIDVLAREGATFFDLVQAAMRHLQKKTVDVLYIVGGGGGGMQHNPER